MKKRSLIPILYIAFLMLPIYWLVAMSFKTTNEILSGFFPVPSDLHAGELHHSSSPTRHGTGGYINSIIYVTINTVLSVCVALPAAYAFSRYRFLGDKQLFFWLLTNRMAPAAVFWRCRSSSFIPRLGCSTRIWPSRWRIRFFNVPLAVWILEGFMRGIPKEIG